jgi:hypothetical protein
MTETKIYNNCKHIAEQAMFILKAATPLAMPSVESDPKSVEYYLSLVTLDPDLQMAFDRTYKDQGSEGAVAMLIAAAVSLLESATKVSR